MFAQDVYSLNQNLFGFQSLNFCDLTQIVQMCVCKVHKGFWI